MITVVLIEDHVSFAQALTSVMTVEGDIAVVGHATTADDAVGLVRSLTPDVAVVDLDLPGRSGIDLLTDLRDRGHTTPCVVLTALRDDAELGRAVEAGAAGVLHKSSDMSAVLSAIRRVAAGGTVLPAAATSAWLRTLTAERQRTWRARTLRDALTPRELQVLHLLAEGRSGPAIAAQLVISAETVQTHIRNLLGKLGVGSRLEAVMLALRLGLVALPDDHADPEPRGAPDG